MIKVGGSLCDSQLLPRIAKVISELAETCKLTIIPGGGPFASLVREWDQRLRLCDSASHWMAIAAMNQYGLLLESQGMGIAVDDPAMLSLPGNGVRIFLPYIFLRDSDPLPHTWSVTSDSIAAYMASSFNAERLVLLKSLDSPSVSPCSVKTAVECGIVDGYFDRYLSEDTDCWIVNGKEPCRLLELQNSGCPGTRVIPEHSV